MANLQKKQNKILSVFSLVMINIIAVDSLRSLPFSAKLGPSLIIYYLLGAVLFLIPVALITAELATAWPKRGGIYIWVREAFGVNWGFVVVWLQWVFNIVWYPTILGLVAAIIAEVTQPELANSNYFVFGVVIIVFWSSTLINCFGMRLSSWVSTFGSIFGTLFPMLLIIALGACWLLQGEPVQISMTDIMPRFSNIRDVVLVTGVLFGLMGLEMSSVHAQEVKNPTRDYPRALLISCLIIIVSLILSSLAVAVAVPAQDLNLVTGLLQAFNLFFIKFNMPYATPIIAVIMIIGAIGQVATWVIGPTKGLLAAAEDGVLPKWLCVTNKYDVPVAILVTQALIVTILSSIYIFLDSVETSYWILTALASILALVMYIIVFAAAGALRFVKANVVRPYKVPGNNWGIIFICAVGTITCVFATVLSFIPPSQINIGNVFNYECILIGGCLVFFLPALLIKKKHVNHN